MLRNGKAALGGSIRLITCRTYQRMPILVEHAEFIIPAIHPHPGWPPYHLLAWSVLPDHFHLLIDPCGQQLGDIVDAIKFAFGWFFRVRTGHRGPIWELRWEEEAIGDDQVVSALDFIESDAVRHGVVSDSLLYPYSSQHERVLRGGELRRKEAVSDMSAAN